MLIEARRSLLLLVDLQTKLYAAMAPPSANFLARVALLTRAAVQLDIPIVVTHQYPQGLGPLVPELAAALPDSLRPLDKMTFSCCADEAIAHALDTERDQVLVAGIETHVCVLQTAFDLRARDRQVYVLADACASRSRADHDEALVRMSREGVRQASVESAIFEWLRAATHPRFRDLARDIRDLPRTG